MGPVDSTGHQTTIKRLMCLTDNGEISYPLSPDVRYFDWNIQKALTCIISIMFMPAASRWKTCHLLGCGDRYLNQLDRVGLQGKFAVEISSAILGRIECTRCGLVQPMIPASVSLSVGASGVSRPHLESRQVESRFGDRVMT